MNYEETLNYIHSVRKFGKKLGLTNITKLLSYIGDPQDKLKFVHVAGTNGKGSTCTMLSYVLKNSGYKTGLFTSPFLEEFTERMQINNEQIPREELCEITEEVKAGIDKMMSEGMDCPSEFEIVTAIGLKYFEREKADIVVFEVGMGGALDATNVIPHAEAAVICSISFDHQQYLGNTLREIAHTKAGIIKNDYDVSVYGKNTPDAVDEILNCGKAVNARVNVCDPNDIEFLSSDIDTQRVLYKKKDSVLGVSELTLALKGEHQVYNTLNVLNTLEILKNKGWNITPEAIRSGLMGTKFTGRFEVMHKDPVIVIDGGHNIEGITSFVNNIKSYFKGEKVILFYGMLNDKQVDESIELLVTIAKKIYTLTPDDYRAVDADTMAETIHKLSPETEVIAVENLEDLIGYVDMGKKDEIYAFTGSLYMIGEARTLLNKLIENAK